MDFEAEDDENCYYFGRECMKIYIFKNQLLMEGAVAQKITETKCWVQIWVGDEQAIWMDFFQQSYFAYHFMQVSFFCNQKGGLLLSFESRTEILECSPLLLQFQ